MMEEASFASGEWDEAAGWGMGVNVVNRGGGGGAPAVYGMQEGVRNRDEGG